MELQKMMGVTRRAIEDFGMIDSGDEIAVGISGGKDSMTLLYVLANLQKFYPKPFRLNAICVDLGFGNMDFEKTEEFCGSLGVPLRILKTDIAEIVFNARKESNPCSLCAKMRKGAFNKAAKALGCNKSAFGHHKDDVIETMLLSLIYEGRMHTFEPVTYLDRSDITLIRPLIYLNEADIKGFIKKYHIMPAKNTCPVDGLTKREYAKKILSSLYREKPGAKERIFNAVKSDIWQTKAITNNSK